MNCWHRQASGIHVAVAFKAFERAAARFRVEHNSLPVLVLENVNFVAQRDLGLLYVLQERDKTACNDDLYKAVLRNIFAADSNGLYTFEDKGMEDVVWARDELASNRSPPQEPS